MGFRVFRETHLADLVTTLSSYILKWGMCVAAVVRDEFFFLNKALYLFKFNCEITTESVLEPTST